MARKRRIGPATPPRRARAGLTRGVDPADRIVRWIGAAVRKRSRRTLEAEPAAPSPSCEIITLSWAQTFGRPANVRPIAPPVFLKATHRAGPAAADLRGR